MISLRTRLGLGLLASLVIMIGLLWLTVGVTVRALMEEHMASRMSHDGESLLGGMQLAPGGGVVLDTRRIQGIYQQPFSGHYFQVEADGHVTRSRSLWDEELQLPEVAVGETRVDFVSGPQQQPLLLWTRGYRKQGSMVRLAVAEDLEAVQAGIRRFQWYLAAGSLAVVFMVLLIQQYIVVRSLRPVSVIVEDIERLETGEISSLREPVPHEVFPLVRAINLLLQRQQQRLQRSREALGNLAHTIKTPLTVLLQLASEKVPAEDVASHAELQRYGRLINEHVNASLRRARLAGDSLGTSRFDLQQDLPVLVDTLTRLHPDRPITFNTNAGGLRQLPFEQQDGMELLGSLLDNAWKWARNSVQLNIDGGPPLSIVIEDDGPGIDAAGLRLLAQRGMRQDENIPGHGIGQSVVRSLVEALGGTIEFATSEVLGGLQVCIRLAGRS